MNNAELELIEVELAILVRRATSLATDMSAGSLDRSGYLLLNQISSGSPVGARALADTLQLDISTVSRQVAALEHKGYVRRSPDPADGRAYFLEMTDSGRAAHEAYKKLRIERIKARTGNWTDEEKRQFGRLLEKFNHPNE